MSYADLFARFKPQVRKVTLSVGDVYVRELTGMRQAQLYDDQEETVSDRLDGKAHPDEPLRQ